MNQEHEIRYPPGAKAAILNGAHNGAAEAAPFQSA
jgi:hypothetical protein